MRVEEGDRVMTFARLEKAEEIAAEAESAEERVQKENEESAKVGEGYIPNAENVTDFAEEYGSDEE